MFQVLRRTLAALALACLAATTAGPAFAQAPDYQSATKVSNAPICQRGDHFDLIGGGSCWRCPAGTQRTVFPVNGAKACEQPAKTELTKASDRGAPNSASPLLPRTDCPRGAFLDIGKGRCYSCPAGHQRTAYAVTDQRACSRQIAARMVSAQQIGKAGCPSGSFYDPIQGGSCWRCPAGSKRGTAAVNGARACEAPPAAVVLSPDRRKDILAAAVSSTLVSRLANGGTLNQTRLSPGGIYPVSAADLAQVYPDDAWKSELFGTSQPGALQGKAYYRWPLAFKRFHSKLLEGLTFAVLSDQNRVILTFYGTNMSFTKEDPGRPGNLIYDIANPPLPSPTYDANTVFPAFAGLADVIYQELRQPLQQEFGVRGKQVIITGHSLGGAVAGHVAYLMLRDGMLAKSARGRTLEHRLVMMGTPRFVIDTALGGLRTTWERNQGKATISSDALEIVEDPTPLAFTSLGLPDLVQTFGAVHRVSKNELPSPKGEKDFLRYHNGDNYISFARQLSVR